MRTCDGCGLPKRLYRFYRHAAAVAIRRSRAAGPLRIYRCPGTRGWHLTSLVERRADG